MDLFYLFDIAKDDRADARSLGMSNQADMENESPLGTEPQVKRKLSKRRTRLHANVANCLNILNGPLKLISLPDDLTSKLNFISSDVAASNRLFTTVLSTKQSSLRLSSGELFIEPTTPDAVVVRTKCSLYSRAKRERKNF